MYEKAQIVKLVKKLKRLEDMLHARLFVKVDQMDMKAYATMEPLCDIPDGKLFETCEKGKRWEQEGLYCWFKGQYQVPDHLAGKKLYILPHIYGYEALLWVNGVPCGNFASKIKVNFGGLGNHYCKMLVKEAEAGEMIDVALEYYAHHEIRGEDAFNEYHEVYEIIYDDVDICVKDELITSFYYHLRMANQMAECLPEDSMKKAEILRALVQVHGIIDYDIDLADPEEWREAAKKADALLQKLFDSKNGAHTVTLGLTGHSHMDTAWLWHMDETRKKCARTFSNQLSYMEQYPEYRFIQSSSLHTYWMEKYYPGIFEKMKKYIAEGRYEPNGGAWIECDCNLPGGESMIRQFLWGQNYTQSRFGYRGDCFWLPDTFGYSASLPQIIKGCGMKYFSTSKLGWNDTNEFPYDTFYWEGIDRTRVFVNTMSGGSDVDPRTFLNSQRHAIKEKTVSDCVIFAYGSGDGGGGPVFESVEMSEMMKDVEGLPRAEYMSVSDLLKKKEAECFRPAVYRGELYLELHRGTLTNQHQIKRNNRLSEIALHNLEYFTVRDALEKGMPISAQKIHPLTYLLLQNQFHDILPGTCIPRAHKESKEQTARLIKEAKEQTRALLEEKESSYIAAYNTLSFEREDAVYLPLEKGYVKGAYLQQRTENVDGEQVLAIAGALLPALASKAFELTEEISEGQSPFTLQGNVLTTPYYQVTFDEKGYFSSLIDLEEERELRGEGYSLNTLLIAEDVPEAWDNWDIDADLEDKMRNSAKLLSSIVVSDGAVEFRIRNEYQLTAKSTLTQDVVFYSTDRKIAFFTKMNWQDDHRFLKTAFDTSIQANTARSEIQFGCVERATHKNTSIEKAKFEVCNHKYTDLSETRYGAALLNDCKYGISLEGSSMWLSLHKGGNRPDYTGDKGIHHCAYAFVPHKGGFGAETVVQPAYEFNVSPVVHLGNGEKDSFAKVDAPNVIIETIKPMEKENGYVVRLYEAEGTRTKANLWLKEKGRRVLLTNMLEEEGILLTGEDDFSLEFRPFEIKTICVEIS